MRLSHGWPAQIDEAFDCSLSFVVYLGTSVPPYHAKLSFVSSEIERASSNLLSEPHK